MASILENETAWKLACRWLESEGFVTGLRQASDKVFVCYPHRFSWDSIARFLASVLPGTLHVTGGHKGVSWQLGRRGQVGIITTPTVFDEVQEAKRPLIELGVPGVLEQESMGGLARACIAWCYPETPAPMRFVYQERLIMAGIEYGFYHCSPGVYRDMELWDMDSCYFNLTRRLPSMSAWVTQEGVIWCRLGESQDEKWRNLLSVIADYKLLRNTLHGVYTGGHNAKPFWYNKNGEVVKKLRPPSVAPFRIAGLLVVHAAYVLTRLQVLQGQAVYANIDCVCQPSGTPATWERFGVPYSLKARGGAEIHHRGSYRVGGKCTEPFLRKEREDVFTPIPGEPIFNLTQWVERIG